MDYIRERSARVSPLYDQSGSISNQDKRYLKKREKDESIKKIAVASVGAVGALVLFIASSGTAGLAPRIFKSSIEIAFTEIIKPKKYTNRISINQAQVVTAKKHRELQRL